MRQCRSLKCSAAMLATVPRSPHDSLADQPGRPGLDRQVPVGPQRGVWGMLRNPHMADWAVFGKTMTSASPRA
jgi:hypothetical protein